MRWPSAPGYGGRSRPPESGPSSTQVIFLAIRSLCRLAAVAESAEIRELALHEPAAEKRRDRRRYADVELGARPAPMQIVAIVDGCRRRGELEQARREVEVEVRERVRDRREHALGRDGRA